MARVRIVSIRFDEKFKIYILSAKVITGTIYTGMQASSMIIAGILLDNKMRDKATVNQLFDFTFRMDPKKGATDQEKIDWLNTLIGEELEFN